MRVFKGLKSIIKKVRKNRVTPCKEKAYRKLLKNIISTAILIFCFIPLCHAEIILDYKKIAMIESSNGMNKKAYNLKKYAIGKYQVSSDVLKEYNQYNRTNFTKKDLTNNVINFKMCKWYFEKRIPIMFKHYKIKDTLKNRLACYNIGIKYLCNKEAEKRYINKYFNN